ncbi:uncharacterized protein LOC132699510 isoform X2 [Cylas formicarius]|uniref:uncharacterized protein LOC132699510 isoform X2 n=1 Tax=Cylas formicarius TaxID=197179 RepID=UPI0029587F9E|nr:uncharacterized protein LOC132699510 isoform X2 [Cylas formicarius]XP_060522249.1 uncharacterized protein LOC132699510 isoform X2 [Cylas formicarius]
MMRQIKFIRRNADHRRVPLNTIVLPPLTPPSAGTNAHLIGKFVVNKSKSGNGNGGDIVLPRSPDLSSRNGVTTSKSPDQTRITQLEHNIKFLQEQHQLMLAGLHSEIEILKSKNRELQFQLVFVRGSTPTSSSSPSSPDEDMKHKVYSSPKPFNSTPLQIELLEKEMGELKLQMQDVESRNVYLSAIVDEQKKKLERYEREREKEREHRVNSDENELLRKLDDAEVLIRRLRRENSDMRRGVQAGSSAPQQQVHYHGQQQHNRDNGYQSPRPQGNRGGSGRHRSGNNGQHYNRGGWFPPLHSQNFWQGNRSNGRNQGGMQENAGSENVLPTLPITENGSGTYQYHRKGSNNNHYHHGGEGRKSRGGHKNGKPS